MLFNLYLNIDKNSLKIIALGVKFYWVGFDNSWYIIKVVSMMDSNKSNVTLITISHVNILEK